MKRQKKILSIFFLLSFFTIVVYAQETINLNNGGRIIPVKGAKSLMVDSPTISFIDTVAVVLEYPTIASISYDNGSGFNDYLILNHLEDVVNPDNYDFILMFSINEVPGGINSGWKFDISPKNIGIPKYWIASQRGIGFWKKLRAIPQMNSVNFLDDMGYFENWGSTIRTFHEIGHNWGVFYSNEDTYITFNTWSSKYPLAYLACQPGGHWRLNWSDKLGLGLTPGILGGGCPGNLFNAFDLYNMGLMDYEEVKSYQYTIYDYSNNSYKINIDSFRYALSLRGEDFYEGDGKRIPSIDNEVKNLRSLIIIIKGKDEPFTADQKNLIIKLAKDIPPDWNTATWGRSKMSVGIDNHLLGQTSILNPINKTLDIQNPVQFNWAAVIGATAYDLQIALDSLFVNMVKDTIITNIQTTISLSKETTYFIKVRAENGKNNGASSKTITFKTGSSLSYTTPTLSTTGISEITSSTAIAGGNITSEGGATVTSRGVCWSTLLNPTISDYKTSDGFGIGSFISNMTGLTPETFYHVRAYATNLVGTGYGDDITFVSLVTGIHENLNSKILIYPNPAKEFLTIDLEMFESKNLTFEIIDPKGTLVYKESITSIPNNFKKNFNVSDKKPGTYIVKIVIDNALYIQKVIIE